MEKPREVRLCECHGEAMRWCKDAAFSAGGRWRCRIKMREWCRKYDKKSYASDPERHRARTRAWYARNAERARDAQRERYANNPEYAERQRAWARENWRKKNDGTSTSDFIWREERRMRKAQQGRRKRLEARREQFENEFGGTPNDVDLTGLVVPQRLLDFGGLSDS